MALRPLLLASLLLSAVAAGCADDSGGPADGGADGEPAPGVLEGVVVDDAIRPMAGVRVVLDGGLANVTTEADGLFRFPEVASGAHVVRASKPGYADAVTQVIVAASEPTPLVKLVLVVDASSLPYASVTSIEGFVECGMYFGSYFAACGGPNVASFILCAQVGQCMGNVTGDRYIVIEWFDATPSFLVTETVWESTQAFGNVLSVWLGSADKEQLLLQPGNTPSVWNRTEGRSPLYGTMDGEMLAESGIGVDSWFLAQVFAGDEESVPVELGLTAQQRFKIIMTAFYGYAPPADWRFTATGAPPPPPGVTTA